MKKQLTVGSLIPHNIIPTETDLINKPDLRERLPNKSRDLRRILLKQNGLEFEITPTNGQTLLQMAMNQAVPLDYKCQKGTCGRCTVKIIEGESQLQNPNHLEQKMLGNQLQDGFRLACQSLISYK